MEEYTETVAKLYDLEVSSSRYHLPRGNIYIYNFLYLWVKLGAFLSLGMIRQHVTFYTILPLQKYVKNSHLARGS